MGACTNLTPLEPYLARAAALHFALEQNDWFVQTYASEEGRGQRAGISAELARLAHEAATDPGIGELIGLTDDDQLNQFEQRYLRRLRFSYERARALSPEFVAAQKAATSAAHDAWIQAREADDFSIFAPHLERVLEFARREAMANGASETPSSMYTALLGTYEPGMTTAEVMSVFSWVKEAVRPLLNAALECPRVADPFATADFSRTQVLAACRELAKQLGFDFRRGGFDATLHPFCSTVGPADVRLTGNPGHGLTKALLGVAHETGHGLFEQGAPDWLLQHFPRPFRYSLGIHESQSRLWENHVCRSTEFWEFFWPKLCGLLGIGTMPSVREQFVESLHQLNVQPIRIQADELTYPLHIILRFELELALLGGSLKVEDLPEAFNAKLKDYLGVEPKTLAEGALQDIHWSQGYIGYFPTYLLGSLFAAQSFATFQLNEPWEDDFEIGDFASLLGWLRKDVHELGHVTDFGQLVQEVTGEPLNPQYWLGHVSARYGQPQPVSDRA